VKTAIEVLRWVAVAVLMLLVSIYLLALRLAFGVIFLVARMVAETLDDYLEVVLPNKEERP
jgi:hypothetical protein